MSERRKTEKDKEELNNIVLTGNIEKIAFYMDGSWKLVSKKYTYVANKHNKTLFKIIRSNHFHSRRRNMVDFQLKQIFFDIKRKKLKDLLYSGNYEKIIFTFEGWKSVADDFGYNGNDRKKTIITYIRKANYPKLTRKQVDSILKENSFKMLRNIVDGVVKTPPGYPIPL